MTTIARFDEPTAKRAQLCRHAGQTSARLRDRISPQGEQKAERQHSPHQEHAPLDGKI